MYGPIPDLHYGEATAVALDDDPKGQLFGVPLADRVRRAEQLLIDVLILVSPQFFVRLLPSDRVHDTSLSLLLTLYIVVLLGISSVLRQWTPGHNEAYTVLVYPMVDEFNRLWLCKPGFWSHVRRLVCWPLYVMVPPLLILPFVSHKRQTLGEMWAQIVVVERRREITPGFNQATPVKDELDLLWERQEFKLRKRSRRWTPVG